MSKRSKVSATPYAVVSLWTNQSTTASIVLIYGGDGDQPIGTLFQLSKNELLIGRGEECEIQLDVEAVSRRHARLERDGTAWTVEDLNSTNGTYVNDVPVTRTILRNGDFLKVGRAILKFLDDGLETAYHEEIYRMTLRDALTGAYTKRYFLEAAERERARCLRYDRPFSIIVLEIAQFRVLNDAHGPVAGDYVLREVAQRLHRLANQENIISRLEGVRFALSMAEADASTATSLSKDIEAGVVSSPFEFEGTRIPVQVTVGSATVRTDIDLNEIIRSACEALPRVRSVGLHTETGSCGRPTDPSFATKLESGAAVVATSLAGRQLLIARSGGLAQVTVLEALLYEELKIRGDAFFGRVEGADFLLVGVRSTEAERELQRMTLRTPATFARRAPEDIDAVPVFGPIVTVRRGGAQAIGEAVSGLQKRLAEIEDAFPQPIAMAARASESRGDVSSVRALGESIVQWLSVGLLCELRTQSAEASALRKTATALHRPVSLGTWIEILRAARTELAAVESVHTSTWRRLFGKDSADLLIGLMSSLAPDRNAEAHRGGDERTSRRLIDDWRPRLRSLMDEQLRPISLLAPLVVERMDFDDSGDGFEYEVLRLAGDGMPSKMMLWSRAKMQRNVVYLVDQRWDRVLALDPLAVCALCPQCGTRELFFLSLFNERDIQFLNPGNGHVIRGAEAEVRRRAVEGFFGR